MLSLIVTYVAYVAYHERDYSRGDGDLTRTLFSHEKRSCG